MENIANTHFIIPENTSIFFLPKILDQLVSNIKKDLTIVLLGCTDTESPHFMQICSQAYSVPGILCYAPRCLPANCPTPQLAHFLLDIVLGVSGLYTHTHTHSIAYATEVEEFKPSLHIHMYIYILYTYSMYALYYDSDTSYVRVHNVIQLRDAKPGF